MVASSSSQWSDKELLESEREKLLDPQRICPNPGKILQQFNGESFASLLKFRASVQSEDVAFANLQGRTLNDLTVTYAQLQDRVFELATCLHQKGASGSRVIIICPTGIEYIVALLACIVSGAVAVPVYEFKRKRHVKLLEGIWTDSKPGFVLTESETLHTVKELAVDSFIVDSAEWICTDSLGEFDVDIEKLDFIANPKPSSITLLQYTSGSTGSPKGVVVSEKSLLLNSRSIQRWTKPHGMSLMVNWLPPYHDMGLVGGLVQPLYCGYPCVLLSPVSVIQRPKLLLQAISTYRGTVAGGPNFIYDTCTDRIRPRDLESVDLSSWQVAFNGAEPINQDTLTRFNARFSEYGFSQKSFTPCFGMAEATLFVSGGNYQEGAVTGEFDSKALQKGLVQKPSANMQISKLISSGVASGNGVDVKIVNPVERSVLGAGFVGEIWLSGSAISKGYWNNQTANDSTFNCILEDGSSNKYMRTGDLGFIDNGELYVVGRIKDTIVIRGRNFHPQDIERSVADSHPELKYGTTAAIFSTKNSFEVLLIIQEWRNKKGSDQLENIVKKIHAAVSDDHEVRIESVIFVKPGSLPKTTSGKIQRRKAKKLFVDSREWEASGYDNPGSNGIGTLRLPQQIVSDMDLSFGDLDDENALMSYRRVVELDENEFFQDEFIQHMASLKLHHFYVPKAYGGSMQSYEELYEIAKLLSRRDLATAVTMSTMIWSCAVWIGGSEEQKKHCAELVMSYNGAMCLGYTERSHGSDLLATEVIARKTENGYEIEGEKWPLHRGSRSDVIVLLARTSDERGPRALSLFLVEKSKIDQSKILYLPKINTHGLRGCDTSGIQFKGATVSKHALIGETGKGIDLALKTFQITRTLCVGLSVGAAQSNLKIATEFALSRRLYKKNAFDIPNVKYRLTGAFADILVMDALGIALSRALQVLPEQFSILSAVGKYGAPVHLEEAQRDMTIVLGARFFFRSEYKYGMFQKTLRDSQIIKLFDGSSEVNLAIVAGQLPLLMRRQKKLFSATKSTSTVESDEVLSMIFDIDSDLPEFDGSGFDINTHGKDTVMESLPVVCAQIDELDQTDDLTKDLVCLVQRIRAVHDDNMAAVLRAGYKPDQPSAFQQAKDYIMVHIAVCAIQYWLRSRSKPESYFRNGDWLVVGLRRMLQEVSVRCGQSSQNTIDNMAIELEMRTRKRLSYSQLPVKMAGTAK